MKNFVLSVSLCFLFTGRIFSQSVEELNIQGQLQFTKGDYVSAIETFSKLIGQSSKNGDAFYTRGLAYLLMGDQSAGCADILMAKKLGVKLLDKKYFSIMCDQEGKYKFLKDYFYKKVDLYRDRGYRPAYGRKDSLRGALRPERNCFDVTYYDLDLKLEPDKKFISGSNGIYFKVLLPARRIQIDLFAQYTVSAIEWNGKPLSFKREYDAMFINFPEELPAGTNQHIKITYSGKPQKAINPPWDGGFVWKKDKNGNRWDGVACEHLGASSWWPCKDHMSDEPDSMQLTFEVPKGYDLISNGTLQEKKELDKKYTSFRWKVKNPINDYDATFYMGKFAHFSDTITNTDGKYPLDYYVLPYNLDNAKDVFKQTREVLQVYEELFGNYPFPEDGFGMVESPYEGMEHQGAIAYGNAYNKKDNRFIHKEYDYIIVHESAHEWWGNSVSAADMADMWIQEGFATYAEVLFMEKRFGYADYLQEMRSKMTEIFNFWPLVQNRHVNENTFASNDVYTKGATMLHNLRCTINKDSLFFKIIKDFALKYKKKEVTSADFINLVNDYTGEDYSPFFEKFLYESSLPVLQYSYVREGKNIRFKYKWTEVKDGFKMPVGMYAGKKSIRLMATTQEQEIVFENADTFHFFNIWSGTEGVERNAYTYYWTKGVN